MPSMRTGMGLFVVAPVILSLLTAGCGVFDEPSAEGMVTINGRPVTGGTVVFTNTEGKSASGAIGKDGRYVANGVPIGTVAVTVRSEIMAQPQTRAKAQAPKTPPARGDMKGMIGSSDALPTAIPPKYGKAETSGLSTALKSGSNTFDINLQAP